MASRFVPAGANADEIKGEAGRPEEGKSLYEILQQNKAAKQEAFEESIRLKNQFRSLDEDEVEFLDSVLESTRANEEAIRKETVERLDVFRKQQEKADRERLRIEDGAEKVESEAVAVTEAPEEQWKTNARKRRRSTAKEVLKGVKVRKAEKSQSALKTDEPVLKSPSTVDTSAVSSSRPSSDGNPAGHTSPPGTIPSIKAPNQSTKQSTTDRKGSGGGLLSLDYDSDDDGKVSGWNPMHRLIGTFTPDGEPSGPLR
ncbi:MAG: hypothetical protein M1823_004600 [Watsoniomyces obsoletus]|nr:MAG: hypothetical protein M1823_004600 [Watsoniomyces obsoletus]